MRSLRLIFLLHHFMSEAECPHPSPVQAVQSVASESSHEESSRHTQIMKLLHRTRHLHSTFEYDGRKDGAEGDAAESNPFELPFRTGGDGDLLDRRGCKILLSCCYFLVLNQKMMLNETYLGNGRSDLIDEWNC